MPQYRKSTRVQQLFNKSTLFAMAHMGEHWMQSRFLLAMLYEKQMLNSNGEVIGNALDFYTVKDGKLVFDKDNVVDKKQSKWTDDDVDKFQLKTKQILRDIHGAYGKEEQAALNNIAVGRMIMSMRKFIAPGFRRRWSFKYYNNTLGDFTEGTYMTFGKFAWQGMIKRALGELKIINTDLHNNPDWYWKNLTKQERANVMRTFYEMLALGSTFVLINVITGLLESGEDDDTFFFNMYMAKYVAQRLNSEMSFYVNPKETFRLMKSPAASYSLSDSTISLLEQLFNPTEVYEKGQFKGEYKLTKKALDLLPVLR
jgi:hypothetical protein